MSKFNIILFLSFLLVVLGITGFILTINSNFSISTNPGEVEFPIVLNSTIIFSDDMNGTNDTNALKTRGYLTYYRGSGPQGTSATWFQGQPNKFPAFNGPQIGYVASDYNVVTGQNNVDCWLVLPQITGGTLAGDSLYFYSRSEQGNPYTDSIRVMYSESDSIPEGEWSEIGRFRAITTGLWEKRGFKATNSSVNGRFAIRYCVVNGGPEGQNSDYIGIDAISIMRNPIPVITHTQLANCPKTLWPSKVICRVTSNIGIDSVWVYWKKNNGLFKKFDLARDSVNNWSNYFNSDTSQIAGGDSIYYKIIARDAIGNKDSSELYKFCILPLNCCIGTGSYSSDFPFITNWKDARTDLLYTASEIIAAGGAPGDITSIAFNVISFSAQMMNDFTVKMQHTTVTSISQFTYSGWTTCYSGTYSLSGTNWQMINFSTPFYWDGISNLLIELCFNNTSLTQNSTVKATSMPGKMVGYSQAFPDTNGCSAPWLGNSLTYRCDLCITINTGLTGIENKPNIIPGTYSLYQNYPNPFNPVTQLKYDLPKQGFVLLKVYDVLGREVSTLVNKLNTQGSYIVDFNGSELSSGVYFYSLSVRDPSENSIIFSSVKKMILLK